MSNVYDLPSREAIYDQASLWIARLDRTLNTEEESQLKEWLHAHPDHREVLFEMAQVWDNMDTLSRLSTLFPASSQQAEKTHTKFYFAAAASVLVVIMSALLVTANFAPSTAPSWLLALQFNPHIDGVYDTSVGEHSRVNLPDGSELVLNTNSRVQVKYSDTARVFLLERGEIHIEVAHDKTRPLSVIAGDKVVQAVGTAFNVQIYSDKEVELIVTDGKVLVAKHQQPESFEEESFAPLPDASLAVSKGEKVVLGSTDEQVAKIETSDIEANLSWLQGNLIFRGETMEEALAEISRYTDVQFEIQDEAVKQIRIAGLFKAGDIKGLLLTLEQNFRIDHERLANNTVSLKLL